MTINTKHSLFIILTMVVIWLTPISILFFITYLAFYALIATFIGESRLESPITGEPTALGSVVAVIFFSAVILPALFAIMSIIIEKMTRGEQQYTEKLLTYIKQIKLTSSVPGLLLGCLFILAAAYSLISPGSDQVGANIGAPVMMLIGLVILCAEAVMAIINIMHKKRPSIVNSPIKRISRKKPVSTKKLL